MNVDRSPMWIGLADLLLCILSVVIVAVAPTKAKVDGVKPKAEFLITADWPVALDSDIDLWLVGPEKKPVFYGAREAGCVSLDRDSLGFSTSQITLALSESNKETAPIRCIAAGHYDIGDNLDSDRELAKGAQSIPARVEITGLNPQVTTLFAGNVSSIRLGRPSMSRASTSILTARSSSPPHCSSRSPMLMNGRSNRRKVAQKRAQVLGIIRSRKLVRGLLPLAASAERCACVRADNRAPRTPYSRAWDRSPEPGS